MLTWSKRNLSKAFDLSSDKMADKVVGRFQIIVDNLWIHQNTLFAACLVVVYLYHIPSSSTNFKIGYR